MQKFKVLCGKEKWAWFEIQPKDGNKFLKWAKDLGCKWVDGKEIDINQKVEFIHFSISIDGKLAYLPAFAWVNERRRFKHYECKFLEDTTSNEKNKE